MTAKIVFMSIQGLEKAQQKMSNANVSAEAIEVFSHYYKEVEAGATGIIREDTIRPLLEVPELERVEITEQEAQEALSKTVVVKLNGGLGTSMGIDKAKSLLPVRDGYSFLDLICKQVLAARARYGVSLPVIFMNSFRTREDTLKVLEKYPDLRVGDLPLDFIQNQEPKLRADNLEPVEWPADPSLEWCPPGHGDIYTALLGTGILKQILDAGYKYMCTSNSDNLGAFPNAQVAGWFMKSNAPYAAEVCRRTINDRKGGHLAVRKADDQLILRDTAQTAPEEMHYFTDENYHPYFHTNNLWFNLEVLYSTLTKNPVLGLPLIKNEKNVDPKDPESPKVIQIETAMGAAIQCFPGAQAICVKRERFLPVKTTNELMIVRSDVYELTDEYKIKLTVDKTPEVDLDSKYYKKIQDFDRLFPEGVPSLHDVSKLKIRGEWTVKAKANWKDEVNIDAEGAPGTID